jgi:hypothetical protein
MKILEGGYYKKEILTWDTLCIQTHFNKMYLFSGQVMLWGASK